jgi:hypothetical protein
LLVSIFEIVQIFFKTVAPIIVNLSRCSKKLLCKLELLAELCNDLDNVLPVFKEGITIYVDDGEPENVYEALPIASEILLVSVATEATELGEAVDGHA